MTTKKTQVKALARQQVGSFTVKVIHYLATGSRYGVKWRKTGFDCSVSTVRKALSEMVDSGELKAFYRIGHCYDECRFEVVKIR